MPYANPTDRVAAQRRYRVRLKQGATEQERSLSAEVERLKAALGESSRTVERLEAELANSQQARERAEIENTELWAEVERLSRVTFPLTVYEPCEPFRRHTFGHVGDLAYFGTHPESRWERSKMLLERRSTAQGN